MLSGAGLESLRHYVSFILTAGEVSSLALLNVFRQQTAVNDYAQTPQLTKGGENGCRQRPEG
jgi:hypothetical protein